MTTGQLGPMDDFLEWFSFHQGISIPVGAVIALATLVFFAMRLRGQALANRKLEREEKTAVDLEKAEKEKEARKRSQKEAVDQKALALKIAMHRALGDLEDLEKKLVDLSNPYRYYNGDHHSEGSSPVEIFSQISLGATARIADEIAHGRSWVEMMTREYKAEMDEQGRINLDYLERRYAELMRAASEAIHQAEGK